MAKPKKYTSYKTKYENFVKNGIPVRGCKYDAEVTEVIENVEDFKQCYNPNFKVRKQLPKYWFISKEGFLINVKGKEPRWVTPNLKAHRPLFKPSPTLKDWPKGKNITTYDLVALTWGSDISEDAYHLLDTIGASVIGKNEMDERDLHKSKVQGHHWKYGYIKENNIESYIKNNNPTNIQIVTNIEHYHLHKLGNAKNIDNVNFKAPKYRKVYSEAPKVYFTDDKPRIANLKDIELIGIIGVDVEPSDEYSLVIGKYEFVSPAGADFIEDNQVALSMLTKHDNENDSYEIHYGKKYYFADIKLADDNETKRVYYRKIK